mmetsp:Transcript_22600/g.31846  ORF Transcript_22600/g.31846 Transcript_22600/m.31846 type:complete len:175 (-) Transcript_22600:163-687(-)|eukprot:CAMPEP_0175088012 /NCGR_PEP_ID=MMETSP0086_2-20121207/25_1 /TAXON_ID=136419 /ORGANISM="Unknown Unknown, Strain D1" /LENGTH=174 /DNA_ID=CAMNT_0016360425 /DNA_START=64 /DNA_END=588 /DNA_ORIENTATION=-
MEVALCEEKLKDADKKKRGELKNLEKALEKTIETIWKCSVIVEDGINVNSGGNKDMTQGQMQLMQEFHSRVNEFMDDLDNLNKEADKVPHITIPSSVIEKVDGGTNPDLATSKFFKDAQNKNDSSRGKLFSTKIYADQLAARLAQWDRSNQVHQGQSLPNDDDAAADEDAVVDI